MRVTYRRLSCRSCTSTSYYSILDQVLQQSSSVKRNSTVRTLN